VRFGIARGDVGGDRRELGASALDGRPGAQPADDLEEEERALVEHVAELHRPRLQPQFRRGSVERKPEPLRHHADDANRLPGEGDGALEDRAVTREPGTPEAMGDHRNARRAR